MVWVYRSEAARLFSQDEDGVWQQLPNSTRASILATGFSNTMRGDALHSMQLHKWHEGFKGTSAAVSVLRKVGFPGCDGQELH